MDLLRQLEEVLHPSQSVAARLQEVLQGSEVLRLDLQVRSGQANSHREKRLSLWSGVRACVPCRRGVLTDVSHSV